MTVRTCRRAILALVAVLAGCPKTDPKPDPAATLTVTPGSQTIAPASAPFAFTATLENSTSTVGWSIVDETCADAGSVHPTTGVYTPPATNDAACTFKVRATAGTLTADASVTLSARYLRVLPASPAVTPGDAPVAFTVQQAGLTGGTTWSAAAGTCVAGGWGAFDSGAAEYSPPSENLAACAFTVTASVDGVDATATVGLSARSAGGTTLSVTPAAGSVRAGSAATLVIGVDSSDPTPTPTCTPASSLVTCAELGDPAGHTHALEVTAAAGLLTATTVVNVAVELDGLTAVVPVTVRPSVLTVAGASTIHAGGAQQTFSVTSPDVSGETIAWTVAPAIGSITAGGRYTSPAVYSPTTTFSVVATIGEATGSHSVSLLPSTGSTVAADINAWADALFASEGACTGETVTPDVQGEIEAIVTLVQSSVDGGRTTWDSAALEACTAVMAARTCPETYRGDGEECLEVAMVPNVPNGGECLDDFECSAGFCSYEAGTCPGSCTAFLGEGAACTWNECGAGLECADSTSVCVVPSTVAEGAECAEWDGIHCEAGLVCVWDGVSGEYCRAPVGLDQPCNQMEECLLPYVCDRSAGSPTCRPMAAFGESCAAAACAPWQNYCDPVTTTCKRFPSEVGAPCGVVEMCEGDGIYCDTSLPTPVCSPLPRVGESCDVALYCEGTARCTGEWDGSKWVYTCVAPRGAGAACDPNDACVDGYFCDAVYPATGTCVAQKTSGACTQPSQCASTHYCAGSPGTCTARKGAGEACATWDECAEPLACNLGICTVESCYWP